MKVALIWTNPNMSWPPSGWGAIEKYVWEYKINLEKLGHTSEIRYSNSDDLRDFDIIQVHTWNQALNLKERGIPYIYSFDDSHVVYFGPSSVPARGQDKNLFYNNLDAIKNSVCSIVHSEYLIEFFGEKNLVYLRHGANPDTFKFLNIPHYEHKLLCVGRTDQDDRKGFGLAIECAKKLNLPITIAGPNEDFFNEMKFDYDKLTIIGNSNDQDLVKLYNNHTIFLHLSKLETGHPNLTLVESIYCGTPIIGTCNVNLDGMKLIKLSNKNLINEIREVIDNYPIYQNDCFKLKNSKIYDWFEITKDLVKIYEKQWK